jgi:hypothetical protein
MYPMESSLLRIAKIMRSVALGFRFGLAMGEGVHGVHRATIPGRSYTYGWGT